MATTDIFYKGRRPMFVKSAMDAEGMNDRLMILDEQECGEAAFDPFISDGYGMDANTLWQQRFKDLHQDLLAKKRKLEEVLRIEMGVQKSLDLHKTIDFAVGKAVAILEAEKCSFLQADPITGDVCVKGHVGIDERKLDGRPLKLGDGISCVMAIHGEDNLGLPVEDEGKIGQVFCRRNFLSVPVHTGESILGIMNISSRPREGFGDFDLRLLRVIVRQLALGLENARLNRELGFWKSRDTMTDIYNYRHCCCLLDYEINRCARYCGELSILMVDIDGFKSFNDELGIGRGDGFLRDLGHMLIAALRQSDTVCRYVGDEFVVVLPATGEQAAYDVAQKICRRARELSPGRPVTVSIGVTSLVKGMDRYGLLRKVELALGMAKNKGKGYASCLHDVKPQVPQDLYGF